MATLRAQEDHIHKAPKDWVLLGCALVLDARPAQAYIDPGSGALVVQAALSALFGTLFLARRTLRKVLSRIGGSSAPREAMPSQQARDTDHGPR
jgi:hypothetical protein